MKDKKSRKGRLVRPKPRVCYVNPPVLLKRPISEISSRLSIQGYRTSVLIPKKLFREVDSSLHHCHLLKQSKVYTYSIVNPPFISSEQPLPVTPAFCINTWKAMRKNDIIHMWVPYYLTSLKIILMKKLFFPKKKLILTMDTVPGYSFSMGKVWDSMFKLYNRLFGWLLFKTPDAITLYGNSLVPFALKAGIPEDKIRIIPTGIELKKDCGDNRLGKGLHESKPVEDSVRKELGLESRAKVVLYVGLIVPRKGIGKIIMIADKLSSDKGDQAVFLLAGDGPGRKKYERMAKELGLEDKVLFLGWRRDIQELFKASDVVLLPAEGEGLPGLVMEAMAAGVPCVASRIPCIPDLIDDRKSGFLCDKDDIECFAARIRELLRDEKKRMAMAREAKRKISGFRWDEAIGKYKGLYNELMRR